MDILAGIVFLLLGLAVAAMGLRLWFWMLPILGFLLGFSVGAILVYQIAGDGILETLLSWIVGFIVGVAFALVSWFWWYFGVILAAGAAGAGLATALAASLGAERDWVFLIVALVGAALFALIALALNLPVYMVIVNTGIAGALAAVTGLLLLIDRIELAVLGRGQAVAIIDNSPLWWLLWIVIAAVGIYLQLRMTAVVGLPPERYVAASRTVRR